MLKTILDTTSITTEIEAKNAMICILTALALGFVISLIYIISDRKRSYSPSFAISLVILPAVVAIVIMLVGSNVARAFSMAGACALARLRSVPGDSKDISSVFFAMAVGLAAGLGYVSLAGLTTLIIGAVYLALMLTGYGVIKTTKKTLRITIPENLNFNGVFDDIFETYTSEATLEKVKTTNLGSMFELTYQVVLKKDADQKKFMDDIRCRNGNLNIVLSNIETRDML